MAKVKNLGGTSDNSCGCGSWLNHWKKHSGQEISTYCSVTSCYGRDLVGAHVKKTEGTDNYWYIVPLCDSCNKKAKDTILSISDYVTLVPANKAETCA